MKNIKAFILGFLMLFSICLSAKATPEDIVNSDDSLFAIGANAFFLLRTVSDNLGAHDTTFATVFLVEISYSSWDERYWPLYQSSVMPEYDPKTRKYPSTIKQYPIKRAVNPFEIIKAHKAVPVGAFQYGGSFNAIEATLTDEDLLGTIRGNIVFKKSSKAILSDIQKSFQKLSQALPAYNRVSATNIAKYIRNKKYNIEECIAAQTLKINGIHQENLYFSRIICTYDDIEYDARIIFVLRENK